MKTEIPSTPAFDFRRSLGVAGARGIWRMMAGFRLAYLAATVALAFSAAAKASTFLLLGYFADQVLGARQFIAGSLSPTLALMAAGFIALAAVEGAFAFVSGRMAAYTSESITRRLRDFLFDHIQRLSFSYHSRTPTGDLIERVTSDVDSLRKFFSEQAIGIGRIVLLFGINWAAILSLNARLGWLSVVVIPVILAVSLWFFGKVTKRYEEYQAQEAILSTTLQENLTGVRVVKAFARQEYEKAKFEQDNWAKFLKGRLLLLMHSLFWPLSDIALGFQMLFGFVYAANMVIGGELTIGNYLTYVGLVVWLIWPIRNLGRMIVETSTGMVSFRRLLDIARQAREPLTDGKIEPTAPLRGDVVFDHVSFTYSDGDTEVLRGLSFHIRPGQALALLGSTGSGKTSLVNLLPRFHEYTAGSIRLDGTELRDYSRAYLRSQIGIVQQEPFLFSRSIRDNILYGVGRSVTQAEVERAARAAAIHDVIVGFPQGYNTLVGEKGVTLSGGQKQRLTIARTLLKDPRLLILDDSMSSVDTETEAEIRLALHGLMQDRTTFIIAHRIQSVVHADLILVLERGSLIQMGTHLELLQQADGVYRRIADIQSRIDAELEQTIAAA
ncbi:MAG TPA: ABC transporter ATP-binding protein [Anaerolineales bacterium]|nr:ABC transporter ATP-binding protein [Anaerolineales bacterium]